MKNLINNESGQGTIEYILLIAIVAWMASQIYPVFKDGTITEKITAPIKKDFKATYQYGHPRVVGFDEGDGPKLHPRATYPNDQNFRIFLNANSVGRGE